MILSEENVLRELAFTADGYDDISEFLECGDELLYTFSAVSSTLSPRIKAIFSHKIGKSDILV